MIKKIIIFLLSILFMSSCNNSEKIIWTEILALWDSLTQGYILDKKDAYPALLENILKENWYNYNIENAWINWHTSLDLFNRIKDYDNKKYDIYLLNIWSNDWLRRMDLDDMAENIWKIITHLKNVNKDAEIILIWNKLPLNYWLIYSNTFSSSFKKIAKDNDVLFYDFLLKWVYLDQKYNLEDKMHPNKEWYKIIAENIYDFLKGEKIIKK